MRTTEIGPDSKRSRDLIEQPPVVRKGQRKPYSKATNKQIEQRIEVAYVLQLIGLRKNQIHNVFRDRYAVEWRQLDRCMARAREKATAFSSCGPWTSTGNSTGTYTEAIGGTSVKFYRVHHN